jgi:transposase-like protein
MPAVPQTTAAAISTSAPNPTCPKCQCKRTVKKGKRRNRRQTLQIYECSECLHHFTAGAAGKNKSYPLTSILEAVSTFNRGYSLTETQQIIRRRFHLDIPERTISSWVAEHRPLTTYSRLRKSCRQLFSPAAIIRSHTFYHQQVYRFQTHQGKLALLLKGESQEVEEHDRVAKLANYLATIAQDFPDHLFESAEHRSSRFPTELHPRVERKGTT